MLWYKTQRTTTKITITITITTIIINDTDYRLSLAGFKLQIGLCFCIGLE
jgi:hypothetical protein